MEIPIPISHIPTNQSNAFIVRERVVGEKYISIREFNGPCPEHDIETLIAFYKNAFMAQLT
jgi:hypothetical protein